MTSIRPAASRVAIYTGLFQRQIFAPSNGIIGIMLKAPRNTLKKKRALAMAEAIAGTPANVNSAKGRNARATRRFEPGPARLILPFSFGPMLPIITTAPGAAHRYPKKDIRSASPSMR